MRTGPAIGLILVAFVLVVGVLFLLTHGPAPLSDTDVATTTAIVATSTDYYADTSRWETYSDSVKGMSIQYPIDFAATTDGLPSNDPGWRTDSEATNGAILFSLMVPKAFEPGTNFADAKLTIGMSKAAKAVADCTSASTGNPASGQPQAVTINGTSFTVLHMSDAGAGNLYDTTTYATVHGGACYAVEYTIHSTNLANYPPSYGLTAFDEDKAADLLDRIVNTFAFATP